jgi:CheY-like chemotaxis protein
MPHVATPQQTQRELTVLFVGSPSVDLQAACDSECTRPVDIDVVTDGRAAIQRLTATGDPSASRTRPDLVLLQCDFELPDGMTVLHAIKSSPRLRATPVVVLDPDDTDSEGTYRTGGNAHVSTPDTTEDYVDLVRSITRFWFEWAQYPAESLYSDT